MPCLWVFGILIQFYLWIRVLSADVHIQGPFLLPTKCRRCRYDFAGLHQPELCPECGGVVCAKVPKSERVIDDAKLSRYAIAIAVSFLLQLLNSFMPTALDCALLVARGYSLSTSLKVAMLPEEGSQLPPLYWASIVCFLYAMLCPVLFVDSSRKPYRAFVFGLGCVAIIYTLDARLTLL